MQLRLALGMTCPSASCLAVDPHTATLAYPSSGVTVLLDILECKQKSYIYKSPQQITCVSFSPDGTLMLTGESGYMPALRVWWVQHEVELARFQEHQYGIVSAAFSQKMDLVVSIGAKHDNFINVWAWPSRDKIACNRFAEDIYSMSFSRHGSYFVTCGVHHVKFWYPTAPKKPPTSKYTLLQPHLDTLYGRPAILKEIKHKVFADVACGSGVTGDLVFTVTKCGLVCKLTSDRCVKMYKRLQNTQLSSLQVHENKLMVGSKCGHIYFFDADVLQLRASVCLPLDICFAEQVMKCQRRSLEEAVEEHRANIFLAYDHQHELLTAALTNGSLCVWDVHDWNDIKKNYYSIGHSGAITGLDIMRSSDSGKSKETLVTVAHDATVRQWNIATSKGISCESSKTIYTEFDPNIQQFEEMLKAQPVVSNKMDARQPRIINVVKVSPERDVLVTGDSRGIISIYDRNTLENVKTITRHTRGITALALFSQCYSNQRLRLLASGGRDRLINIFNLGNNYSLLNSLNLHSGTVTSIGFCSIQNHVVLFSSGLDRSLVMCKSEKTTLPHFRPCHCRHLTKSVIDIVVCPLDALIAVGRINGKVSIMDAGSFVQLKRFHACLNENARLEKLQVHPKSNLMLTACSDRTLNVLSFTHGLVLASVSGHAKGISGLEFSLNMKFIVSTSRDGCIFIWGIPEHLLRRGVKVIHSSLQTVHTSLPTSSTDTQIRPKLKSPHLMSSVHGLPLKDMAARGDFAYLPPAQTKIAEPSPKSAASDSHESTPEPHPKVQMNNDVLSPESVPASHKENSCLSQGEKPEEYEATSPKLDETPKVPLATTADLISSEVCRKQSAIRGHQQTDNVDPS